MTDERLAMSDPERQAKLHAALARVVASQSDFIATTASAMATLSQLLLDLGAQVSVSAEWTAVAKLAAERCALVREQADRVRAEAAAATSHDLPVQ